MLPILPFRGVIVTWVIVTVVLLYSTLTTREVIVTFTPNSALLNIRALHE